MNLTVLFNHREVHFVTGNTMAWTFITDDYEAGATNITLVGWDAEGRVYGATTSCVFLNSSTGSLFIVVILALVVVVIMARYGSRIARVAKDKGK